MEVLIKRVHSAEKLARADVGARGKLRGSHIDDLVALGKLVLLCEFCRPKFNAPANHYERYLDRPVAGNCDACSDHGWTHSAFTPEFRHDAVAWEPYGVTRRRGRWAKGIAT